MLTRIDILRDELIATITTQYGNRVNDISFDELKQATLLGFNSGIEATKLDTEFAIGEIVWYITNRKIRAGRVISYQIEGVESADHRELYRRIRYTVTPTEPGTATQHLELFTSKLGGSDLYHTSNEAKDALTLT